MIDVLNQKVEAKPQAESNGGNYTPLPDGDYHVKVVNIDAWKPTTKDVMVNVRDGKGSLIKDDNGKVVKELHKNLTFYNADVKLEVLGGEFAGRKIFTSLTTHPNATFITEAFLYAVNKGGITYGQIVTECVGLELMVTTENETVSRTVTNKETGLEETVEKTYTRVKGFSRPSQIAPSEAIEV